MPLTAAPIGPVRVLLVEDNEQDAELTSEQLLEAGLEASFLRVESAEELAQALAGFKPDLVLSDLSMPGFSGEQALHMVRARDPSIPFIYVSGTMGEETAVQALREGAVDYILKDNTTRLPAAAARAIRESRSERERERVERELLRSQRMDSLAMLAAGLSHDLRNILQPLLIVPDLLAMHSQDPKIRKLGEVIAESGRRGHEMAESMLSFVRGARKPREHVPLDALFQATQVLLQGSLPRNVRMAIDPPAPGLAIYANYTELQQALVNLCLNGIQAMPGGGELCLSTRLHAGGPGGLVGLRVSDQGCGMDPATRSQLFTPFFTTKAEGTGLGLMSCLRIARQYDGRIDVESTPGAGSTFELVLPLAVEAATVQARTPSGRGQRILLVDSDSTRRVLLCNALEGHGYQATTAPDGAYALRVSIEEGVPDLLLVDSDIILLPVAELLEAMYRRGYAGPVVVLQDPAHPVAPERLPAGLPLHTLDKPVEILALFQAVANTLGMSEAAS